MNPNYVPALLEYARFQLAKKVLHVADVCVCVHRCRCRYRYKDTKPVVYQDLKMADYYFQHTLKKDPSNGDAMLAYAQFLRQHRKDAPGALALYRKAAELYMI